MQLDILFRHRRRAVSLAPLIDVVFILLLFFMLTTSFIQQREIPISAPATSSDLSAKSIHVLRLEADDGTFVYASQTYRIQNLAELTALVAEQPDAVYAVDAAPEIRTQSLVNLLDSLKQAGATHLSLIEALP